MGGGTPLHLAAANNSLRAIEKLHIAVREGHANVLDTLLEASADVNAKNESERTPLHLAVLNGNQRAIEKLLTTGAEVSTKDLRGATPLHYAVTRRVIQRLLVANADIDARDHRGWTPLQEAAVFGFRETVEILIRNGANTSSKDSNGNTILHSAVGEGIWSPSNLQQRVVKTLVAAGLDINARNQAGLTPLDLAAANEGKKMVGFLRTLGGRSGHTSCEDKEH